MSTQSLPHPHSIDPADNLARASVTWGRSNFVRCQGCGELGLVGYLGHKLVGFACHKCGPLEAKNPPVEGGQG